MIGAVLCSAGLLGGALTLARTRRLPTPDDNPPPAVSVVIAARNEAATLPDLLRSLQRARPAPTEVVVVDDDSDDATAAVAAAHGARVVRLDDAPPSGWTGKNRACARGAAAAAGPLLLFLDADVVLADDAVARLAAAHARHGGLVSVQPFHTVHAAYEELSAGPNLVAAMGSGAFAAWSSGRRPAAFGPCLLTSVADYAAVGGHTAVRGEVVEDIALAQRYAAAGLPVTVFLGADAVAFRMYPRGVTQLVDGWTKNLASGSRTAQPVAVLAAAAWLAAALAVGVHAAELLVRWRSTTLTDAAWAALGWLAVAVQMRWALRRLGSFRAATAWLHPVALWAFVALFTRSLWLTAVRRSVRWSGRRVDLGRQAG